MQLRAVIWCTTAANVRCDLHDGSTICRGHLDVYAARGTDQIVIEEIQPKGLGVRPTGLAKAPREAGPRGAVPRGAEAAAAGISAANRICHQPDWAAIREFRVLSAVGAGPMY